MKDILIAVSLCFFCLMPLPSVFSQVQDMHLSVKQFEKINAAKNDVKKIKKGITKEGELLKWFGKERGSFMLEEPVTKEDRLAFIGFLKNFIPEGLKPQSYVFPTINQKVLIYVFPWVFEHPVPCSSRKGECLTAENLVVVVTVNNKTGIVDDFASFDFHFEREFKK
ncbi:MAG: hypothetical protein PHP17_03850 [Candidatus Omnitrophica bacterium]|nr:hypothetical protein [Candidatus Omnitrophota bacterium]